MLLTPQLHRYPLNTPLTDVIESTYLRWFLFNLKPFSCLKGELIVGMYTELMHGIINAANVSVHFKQGIYHSQIMENQPYPIFLHYFTNTLLKLSIGA